MLWFYEVYYNDTHDEYAVLSVWREGTGAEAYVIDFGSPMLDKIYKRRTYAVKYLEKCGYEGVETVFGGKCPIVHNGRIMED